MLRIFILVLFIFLPKAQANPSAADLIHIFSQTSMSDELRETIYFWEMQNPTAFSAALRDIWLNQDLQPRVRVQAAWWLGRINPDDAAPGIDILKVLEDAKRLAQQLGWREIFADIDYLHFAYEMALGPPPDAATDKIYQEKLQKIDNHKLKIAGEVGYLVDLSLKEGLSQTQSQRLAALQQAIPLDPISNGDLNTLSNLALALRNIEQWDEYKLIDQKLNQVCGEREVHSFCMLRAYEEGFALAKLEDPLRSAEAIQYLQRSLELARLIGSPSGEARAHYGLLIAHLLAHQAADAIEHGQKAVAFFQHSPLKQWASMSLLHLSQAYLQAQDLMAAESNFAIALGVIPEEFATIQALQHKVAAEIAEAKGNASQALQEVKAYWALEAKIRADDAKSKYMQVRNAALLKDNVFKSEQISLLKKFRNLAIIASILTLMLCLSFWGFWRQAQMISKSRQQLKDVLDNVDQGIAVLGPKLTIQAGYSPYLHDIFQQAQPLETRDFIDVLVQNQEKNEIDWGLVRESLRISIGETALAWDFNSVHLPREIKIHGKTLSLHWQALFDKQGLIQRFMVALRDVTTIKSLELKVQAEHSRLESLDQKVREILQGKAARQRSFIASVQDWLAGNNQDALEYSKFFRIVHQWKGSARSLGLIQLSESLHGMEAELKQRAAIPPDLWQRLSLILGDYDHLLNVVLVAGERQTQDSGLWELARHYQGYAKKLFQDAGIEFLGLTLRDSVESWPRDLLARIDGVLIQALHNSVDHGFLRRKAHSRPAEIHIAAAQTSHGLSIELRDNGAGIDWSFLAEQAKQKNLDLRPRSEWIELLFEDGVSSASQLSLTSGRGMGLASMRQTCRELGGSLELKEGQDEGTCLILRFPPSVSLNQSA